LLIVKVIKLRAVSWAIVPGEKQLHIKFWLENLARRYSFENAGVGGKITLGWILKK
jgi:hypothetical protein